MFILQLWAVWSFIKHLVTGITIKKICSLLWSMDNEDLVLRPMNCPHHMMIYKNGIHSYRNLPIRIAELGTMHRYEMSGALTGLQRVRGMTLNDAHIFRSS